MGNNALRHYYKPQQSFRHAYILLTLSNARFYKHFDRLRYKVTNTKMAGWQGSKGGC